MLEEGLKYDEGRQPWYAMPLEVLKPLADVFAAGEKKYKIFNCLKPFEDSDRRFYDAQMRHTEACQLDPLAIDEETGVYHGAQAAWNALLRIHNAKKRMEENTTYTKAIVNPLSVNGVKQPVQTVLRCLAGQNNCDGDPYDQMIAAADYIDQLEMKIKYLKEKENGIES